MTSTIISIPVTNNTFGPRDSYQRINKGIIQRQSKNQIMSWTSEAQQKLYRSKLLQALRQVRLGSISSVHSAPLLGQAVRAAADRVLAMTAKGRSRWSRAILANQLKHKSMKRNRRLKKPRVGFWRMKEKSLRTVQRKARDLRRLVPGCRKQPLCVVLEEVMDYVSALDMQVKVMADVADRLHDGSGSGSGFVAGDVNVSQVGISR